MARLKSFSLTLMLIVSATIAEAQIVTIPDENFKNRLIELGIDTDNDGEISYAEAEATTGTLDLSYQEISDLTGINAFTEIATLDVDHNLLTDLNLDEAMNLWNLDCSYNQLVSLDYFNVKSLMKVDCSNNNLTSLNANNIWYTIQFFYCQNNQLAHLTVNLLNLRKFNCSNNQLSCLTIKAENGLLSDLYCSENTLEEITIQGKNTIDTLDLSYNNIESVRAEYTIKNLLCDHNQSTSIDISNVPFLDELYINDNPLLKKLIIRHYPITYEIHDDDSDNYSTALGYFPQGDQFRAGQVAYTFAYDWDLSANSLNETYLDLDDDGNDDVYFEIETIINYGGEEIISKNYIEPLGEWLLYSGNDYDAAGLDFNEPILLDDLTFQTGQKVYYSTWSIPNYGTFESYWEINDGYLVLIHPGETDTAVSWIKMNRIPGPNLDYVELDSWGTWKPCLNVLILDDVTASIADTVILDAGEGFDRYQWSTGDTTQTITVYGENLGAGIFYFDVIAYQEGCYYTDTVQVQVVENSGIKAYIPPPLAIYPNPAENNITIENPGAKTYILEIADLSGRIHQQLKIREASTTIHSGELPSGSYIFRFISPGKIYNHLVIKR